jgi:hypothetical protein
VAKNILAGIKRRAKIAIKSNSAIAGSAVKFYHENETRVAGLAWMACSAERRDVRSESTQKNVERQSWQCANESRRSRLVRSM